MPNTYRPMRRWQQLFGEHPHNVVTPLIRLNTHAYKLPPPTCTPPPPPPPPLPITSRSRVLWKTLNARIEQLLAHTNTYVPCTIVYVVYVSASIQQVVGGRVAVHHHQRRRRPPGRRTNRYFGDVRSVYIRVVSKAFFVSFCSIAELCARVYPNILCSCTLAVHRCASLCSPPW